MPLAHEDGPETFGLAGKGGGDQEHSDAHITISRCERGLGDVDGGNGEKVGSTGLLHTFLKTVAHTCGELT